MKKILFLSLFLFSGLIYSESEIVSETVQEKSSEEEYFKDSNNLKLISYKLYQCFFNFELNKEECKNIYLAIQKFNNEMKEKSKAEENIKSKISEQPPVQQHLELKENEKKQTGAINNNQNTNNSNSLVENLNNNNNNPIDKNILNNNAQSIKPSGV
jgi:hypothetical protein